MSSCNQCPAPSVGVMNTMVSVLTEYLLQAHCDVARSELYPPDYGEIALHQGLGVYDFVVIGAGTAGSVVASRLSENPQWKVLILEAGDNPPQESEIPALSMTIPRTSFMYNYTTEANKRSCRAFKNDQCYWPRGKVLGGSGAVNGLMYLRGNRKDYDNWLEAGNPGWGYDDIWPYFEKSLTLSDTRGYIEVNQFEATNERVHVLLLQAAKEIGQPLPKSYGKDNYLGYTRIPGTVKNGLRTTTAKGYLTVAAKRSNLHVIKNAQVMPLEFVQGGQKVRQVKFNLRNHRTMKVNVRKEVILSAGAIDSPKLLMLSGVGPVNHLRSLQIPVKQNLPVGYNLQDHVMSMLFVEFNGPEVHLKNDLDGTYEYLIYRKGPLATIGSMNLVGLVNLEGHNSKYPELQIIHRYFKKGEQMKMQKFFESERMKNDLKEVLLKVVENKAVMMFLLLVAHPKSRGSLRLKSKSQKDLPIIDANYFDDDDDMKTMVKALHYIEKFINTSVFQEKEAKMIRLPLRDCNHLEYKSDEYWRCYTTYMTKTCFHPVGTAKMGPLADNTTVVDPRLRVKGLSNVRVVDASIMPTIPGVNTNGPTIMIAEKASDIIKEDWAL
ncbi:glucose dehydrogenase [FAD, quinone]-like [Haematobia irritans]|uniref:glucose dehydrogenase [FAD, quinone]-like n=1 Tax=Haematobia irritans TaxID=7368 RepID=UPI003F50ACCD